MNQNSSSTLFMTVFNPRNITAKKMRKNCSPQGAVVLDWWSWNCTRWSKQYLGLGGTQASVAGKRWGKTGSQTWFFLGDEILSSYSFRDFNNKLGVRFQGFFLMFYPRNVGEDENPQFWRMAYVSNGLVETNTNSKKTGWWFQICFIFTPNLGEDDPILTHIFTNGLVQPPTRKKRRFFFRETLPASTNKNPLQIDLSVLRSMIPRCGGKLADFLGVDVRRVAFFFQGGCLFHSKMYGIIYDFGYKRVIIIGTP